MRVKRDFEEIYATEEDPWSIGDADSDRYNLYVELILAGSTLRGSVLELGCGFGALLARFQDHFDHLTGLELSERAVARGRKRFPFIDYVVGSLSELDTAFPRGGTFDTIIVSDVLYYLKERQRQAAVRWIAEHLRPGGLAFIAGWSPGGRYLTVAEFRNLVARELAIEREDVLESGHAVFCARRRRTLVALTVDSETWQPQLEGLVLDWEVDVLRPTARLLDVMDEAGTRITLFAEMGEHLWLRRHRPHLAERIEEQWREAVGRGHDVQLHLHPNWLPEMEPREVDGQWSWDMERTRAADYPGDLVEAISRCKKLLEEAIRPARTAYEVVAYRAGTYEAQPFDRLYDALAANGIWCDSSVLPGDRRPGRHYDYRHAYQDHQPWFAARFDPQLAAPPSEQAVVEVPIFTPRRGERWTFDNEEGPRYAERLLAHLQREPGPPSSEALRRAQRLRSAAVRLFDRSAIYRWAVRWLLPRRIAHLAAGCPPDATIGHRYFVLVAHTKTELDFDAIADGLRRLHEHRGIEFVTMSEMARVARAELSRSARPLHTVDAEQEDRALAALERAAKPRLERIIPLDRKRTLDTGSDPATAGDDIRGAYDCVNARLSLVRTAAVMQALEQIHRLLADDGCLVAGVPLDGLNPRQPCSTRRWRTIPSDVDRRLRAAGFGQVELEQVDSMRELGAPPDPPSRDQLLLVRAWKQPVDRLDRIVRLTRWAYEALDPARAQESHDPLEILAGGYAWCWGYILVLGEALVREGYDVRWVTMIAEDHPLGLGPQRRDSHEVLEVILDGERRVVCDPMVGIVFEASLAELLRDPTRADTRREEDERYSTRNYGLYSTSSWYRLVRRVAIRARPNARLRYVDAARLTG